MDNLGNKLAFLQGVLEGAELDQTKKETKIVNNIVELLDGVVSSVSDLETQVADLTLQVDEIDRDLAECEEQFFGDCCDCDDCSSADYDDIYYEVTCPNCNKIICLDQSIMDKGGMDCPNCGELLEFELALDA